MKTPEELAEEWARSETAQTLANYYEVAAATFLGQQKTFQAHIDGQNTGFKNGFLAGYKAAENHFRDATEKVGPQWINVKDRLPDIYQRVLILIRGRIFISSIEEEYGDEYRDGAIRFWDGDWDWPEVTHWMELPAPPKEEK